MPSTTPEKSEPLETQSAKRTEYRQIIRTTSFTALCICLTPVLVLLATTLNQYDTTIKEKIHNDLSGIVDKHRIEIDSFLREKVANIQSTSLSSSPEELRKREVLNAHLKRLRHVYGHVFEDLGLISPTGELVNYAGPLRLQGVNYGEEEWFKKAMQQDHTVSDVFLGFRGIPHFIITVRMNDEKGDTWLLRSTIDFESFNTIVRNIRIGKSGFAAIVNRKGMLQARLLQDISPHLATYRKLLDMHVGDALVSHEAMDGEGKKQIYVAGFLNNGDWMMIAQQRKSDAFSDLVFIRKISIILFLFCAALMAAMVFYVSRNFLRLMERKETEEKSIIRHRTKQTDTLASFGELATEIVHRINSPLTLMMEEAGRIDNLLMGEDKQKVKNWSQIIISLRQIQFQAQGCKKNIHRLQALAHKSRSGPHLVQVNDIIREMLPMCESRTKHTKTDIEIRLDPNIPKINAFRSEIQQVFLNLANNAIDAMESDGGILSFQTGHGNGWVEIQISDTGPGIPEANLEKIFEHFFTTKPVGKSAGFGIPISYEIVTAMRGRLEVESIMGAGTTFHILLPEG